MVHIKRNLFDHTGIEFGSEGDFGGRIHISMKVVTKRSFYKTLRLQLGEKIQCISYIYRRFPLKI